MATAQPSPLSRLWTALLDLLYTRRCEVCETQIPPARPGPARWLCDGCLNQLPKLDAPYCSRCGEPYEGAITSTFQCGNCRELKLHFEFAIAGYQADASVRELVHRFKYGRQLHLRGLLASLMMRALEEPRLASADRSGWLLVPIPLHHVRRREREYNQSWELCTRLTHLTAIPSLDALERVRATTPQATLSRQQRLENLRRAFRVQPSVARRNLLRDKTVLLVDDVLTTGSTANECAKVLLRDAGVSRVVVLTVARG